MCVILHRIKDPQHTAVKNCRSSLQVHSVWTQPYPSKVQSDRSHITSLMVRTHPFHVLITVTSYTVDPLGAILPNHK